MLFIMMAVKALFKKVKVPPAPMVHKAVPFCTSLNLVVLIQLEVYTILPIHHFARDSDLKMCVMPGLCPNIAIQSALRGHIEK